MKKFINIFLAVLITLFAFPVNAVNVSAEGEKDFVKPDKAYELEYTILHEDGKKTSNADGFFKKPGILLEKNGETYLQFTVSSADMVKSLSNKYGDYVLVSYNKDNSMTLQLRVPNDLSNMKLDMHIFVPGGAIPGFPGYDEKHEAILNFNKNSKREIESDKYQLRTAVNENGPIPESIDKGENPDEGGSDSSTIPDNGQEGNGGSSDTGNSDNNEIESPDKEDESNVVTLEDGNYKFDVSYLRSDNDNTSSMGRYLGDTVFAEVKDGKVELTVTVTDKDSVTKLKINDKLPVEIVEDKDGRYERFVLEKLELITDAYVEYQAPFNGGIHEGNATFRIALDRYSVESVTSEDKPGYGLAPIVNVEPGVLTPVKGDNKIVISGDEKSYLITPKGLSKNVSIKVTPVDKENLKNLGKLELAGQTYNFQFSNLNSDVGEFELALGYDASEFPESKYVIAIYHFKNGKWEKVETVLKNGIAIATVKNFSMYGVFAIEKPSNSKDESSKNEKDPKPQKPSIEQLLKPDKVYEVEYTILHEDGKRPSISNDFFRKPGIILEKDGKRYIQMTIESAEMIKSLSNKYGDYVLVSNNQDGTITVQLRIPNDFSNMKLNMHIVVPAGAIPGFPGYNQKHGAILSIGASKEVPVGSYKVALSENKNNENGLFVEGYTTDTSRGGVGNNDKTPTKPNEFGNNDSKGNESSGENPTSNPKTGDTSQLMFFTLLLIGSLITLSIQIKRRLA